MAKTEKGPNVPSTARSPRDFSTCDVDRARADLCDVYYPLDLETLSGHKRFSLNMQTMTMRALTLGLLTYTSDVSMDCGDLRTAYHVNIPLCGDVASSCGEQEVVATPDQAAVFTPTGRTVLHKWSANTAQLCLKIDRSTLENELADRIGQPVRAAVRFKFGFDMNAPGAQSWLNLVRLMATEFNRAGGLATHPLLTTEIERLIVGGLLLSQPHNYMDQLARPIQPTRPKSVKQVIDLIESSPDQPWTVNELARAVGVSVRSLEDGFQRHVGTTPRTYLRNCRLERVHQQLLNSAPNETTVSEVAYQWGFAHLSRFARFYQQRFGNPPSQTLRHTSL